MKVLALTVGGSCTPIVRAIQDYAPDHVCFFATSGPHGSLPTITGPGDPCGDKRRLKCPECGAAVPLGDPEGPNIVRQAGLEDGQFEIVTLQEPDALDDCYAMMRQTLNRLSGEYPGAQLIADYTGGTKTMSAALTLAAVQAGWHLSLVRGQRTDLIQVADGTEIAGLVNAWDVRAQQQMQEAERLFNDYAYASANEVLSGLQRSYPLSSALQHTSREWIAYCRGFDAWDRFDHARAAHILATVPGEGIDWRFLKALTGGTRGTGYERVLDLLLNADRRAARGRYDDAAARLYRALELLAQTRLRQREPPLDSSDLDLDALPEDIRPRHQRMREIADMQGAEPKVRLGLMEDYLLLQALDDPLGQAFSASKGALLDAIGKRNNSILAHGLIPMTQSDYEAMGLVINGLLQEGMRELGIRLQARQFPRLSPAGLCPREQEA